MEIALLKLCTRCNKRIDYNSSCKKCEEERKKERTVTGKRYDKEVRNNKENIKYTKFYHSPAWINLSEVVKLNFLGLCAICATENKNDRINLNANTSDTTHHIVELRENWELRLVEDNLIPLCHYHHNKIHANYNEKERNNLGDVVMKFKELYL